MKKAEEEKKLKEEKQAEYKRKVALITANHEAKMKKQEEEKRLKEEEEAARIKQENY